MTRFDQNQIPGLSPAQANQSHRRIKTPQHAAPEWITSTQHHAVSNNAANTGSDFGMGFGERTQPMSARRVKADANNAPDWMNTGNTQTDYSQGSYGIGNRIIEDRHVHQPLGGEVEAGYGVGNRMIDDRHVHQPLGGEVEAGYGVSNRMIDDRHVHQPLGGEVEAGYGIGNRMIDDRHTHQPLGGENEAGYGIGNRVLSDSHSQVTHKKSNPSSNQQSSSIHLGGNEQAHHISEAQYSANLAARIQSRPF